MSRYALVVTGIALLGLAGSALAECRDSAGTLVPCADQNVVRLVNQSSNTIDVSIDGAQACSLAPDATCEARLSGDDADAKHALHASIMGSSWDDSVSISECHWNWNGVKTYTFTDNKVPFECAGGNNNE